MKPNNLRRQRFACSGYRQQNRPTKRAPDVWESARFRSIFLASGFFCSQAESTPAHTQVTQTVGRFLAKHKKDGNENRQ